MSEQLQDVIVSTEFLSSSIDSDSAERIYRSVELSSWVVIVLLKKMSSLSCDSHLP